MKKVFAIQLVIFVFFVGVNYAQTGGATFTLPSKNLSVSFGKQALGVDGLFYETASGRTQMPAILTAKANKNGRLSGSAKMPDGRTVSLSVVPDGGNFDLTITADRTDGIVKWGLTLDAAATEYYTGLMERVVDGPQQASWAPGIKDAMNLRGQKVDMIIKPTTSVYAPFYLSSRGYGVFVKGDWPGFFDFAASDPGRVKIEFEGPKFELKVYMATDPATIVKEHSVDAGLPILPPRWMFTPWRWRDEHTQRTTYYDGTPVTGPFNSEVMEDILMMHAYGIPNGVYWIDRPWGPGKMGYDDFDIDENRLPHFDQMVKWLQSRDQKTVLWIAAFFQGKMADEGTAKGYTLAGQVRPPSGNNFPMVD
ncbi:MAG: TIM-barrel domain-containing protein, partial [Acidobacteriota bacterium]